MRWEWVDGEVSFKVRQSSALVLTCSPASSSSSSSPKLSRAWSSSPLTRTSTFRLLIQCLCWLSAFLCVFTRRNITSRFRPWERRTSSLCPDMMAHVNGVIATDDDVNFASSKRDFTLAFRRRIKFSLRVSPAIFYLNIILIFIAIITRKLTFLTSTHGYSSQFVPVAVFNAVKVTIITAF